MTTAAQDVSVRDQITPTGSDQSLFDVLRAIGARSFEACVNPDDSLPYIRAQERTPFSLQDASSIRALQDRLKSEEIAISALLLATDFSADDADRHVAWAVRIVRKAAEMGVPVVRIDTLTANHALSAARVRENFIKCVDRLLRQTADTGVDLGMENHGPISNDPRFLDEVLAALSDPRLGLTLDTGNFYWWGHPLSDVYRLVERYAPRTHHTHLKNVNYPPEVAEKRREIGYEYKQFCCPVHQGNLDLFRLISILRGAGYQRDWCIEDESLFKVPPEQRIALLRDEIEAIRSAAGRTT